MTSSSWYTCTSAGAYKVDKNRPSRWSNDEETSLEDVEKIDALTEGTTVADGTHDDASAGGGGKKGKKSKKEKCQDDDEVDQEESAASLRDRVEADRRRELGHEEDPLFEKIILTCSTIFRYIKHLK